MPNSQKTESTAQAATGAENSQVVPRSPALPTMTETQLSRPAAPTLVGDDKRVKFAFTDKAEEPSVHVAAEQAAQMSEFDEIRNRIERETEKGYPGYRGPRSGAWTPGTPSLLDNPRCTCNGTFDHVTREWHHHVGCPAHGDDRELQQR